MDAKQIWAPVEISHIYLAPIIKNKWDIAIYLMRSKLSASKNNFILERIRRNTNAAYVQTIGHMIE